jgi:hypothetical protein
VSSAIDIRNDFSVGGLAWPKAAAMQTLAPGAGRATCRNLVVAPMQVAFLSRARRAAGPQPLA